MTLEEKIFMALYVVGPLESWDLQKYELFISGGLATDWEDLAKAHYDIDNKKSFMFFTPRLRITVIDLIKQNLSLALTSPSPYVRTFAKLIRQEQYGAK